MKEEFEEAAPSSERCNLSEAFSVLYVKIKGGTGQWKKRQGF
jgi:hypothetical protein